ncbi:hypothetical protein LUZ60_013135 [Juncus effusus]|nr:hypothetical protein LUZ60_013135 [Juncus effusus]
MEWPLLFQAQIRSGRPTNSLFRSKPKPFSLFSSSRRKPHRTVPSLLPPPTAATAAATAVMGRDEVLQGKEDGVNKSPNDRRLYRKLRLDNGLFVLLVHDPEIYSEGYPPPSGLEEEEEDVEMEEASSDDDEEEEEEEEEDEMEEDEDEEEDDEVEVESELKKKGKKGEQIVKKAAAAMCVGMGSCSDPPNAQGLAHFLEHMLFMGSSEFPDENDYDSFLAKHGGSSNAFTEFEHTCYYFEVNREFLNGALKRFSQFFISPLVKADAMDRELNAVDSEFNQVLQSDDCRLLQVHCNTALPGHPLNRFFWGNKKSLSDAAGSGVNMREEILKLYNNNYHAGIMKLVVIGGEPLDILQNWVVDLFSKVKPGPQMEISIKNNEIPVWPAGKLYRLEAVKDLHDLHLSWTLPCLHKEYLKKPHDYIAHLLGHEGRGSILYLLKAKGWATSLSASVEDDGMLMSSFAYIFIVNIRLTDAGLDKMYEVINVVYEYIKLLNSSKPQEWIFKELQDMGNMDFRFAEEQPQCDYAVTLSENAIYYKEKHIVCGEYIFEEWDPALVQHILGFFTPDNMRVDVITKEFNKNCQAVQIEPWFGSRYTEEEIPKNLLEAWRNPNSVNQALHLPFKNEFIPTDFSLRNINISKPNGHVDPICIIDQPFMKFWYKMDFTFNVPRANTYFLISVKDGYKSVKNSVLTELFVHLLKDELNDVTYQASVAKLESSLSIVLDKIELKLYGYNDKISVLLTKILSVAQTFSPKLDRFKVIKEEMERSYRNTNMKPLSHSTNLRIQVLRETFWDVNDKLNALINLDLSDLSFFIPHLISQLYVEGLCHGNLSKEEAINISNIFTNVLCAKPLNDDLKHRVKILNLEPNAKFVKSVPVKNELESNSVAELYYQIELDKGRESCRLKATIDLLTDLISETYFDRLRTKEQLGYTVDCGARVTYYVLGLCFRVQSSKFGPSYLQGRIENFIDSLPAFLEGLDEESFEHHKDGLIAQKLEKDPTLTSETDNYWYQITNKRYIFDMHKIEAEELKTIKKDDVINLFNNYLRPESPKCRRIAFHVCGCDVDSNADVAKLQENNWKLIVDPNSFKKDSEFYPSSLC